jgi:hypothetical protein
MAEELTKRQIKEVAQVLSTIRMLLEGVSFELLKQVLRSVQKEATVGPLFNPGKYTDAKAFMSLEAQRDSCKALMALKRAWRQDVPLTQRIQEELDRGVAVSTKPIP